MTLEQIRRMPTTIAAGHASPVHESILRSYHVLQQVKKWIAQGVPHGPLIELIADLESAPQHEWHEWEDK